MAKTSTSKIVESVPVALVEPVKNPLEGERVLEVEVSYSKGGANYFSGTTSPRGYYLRVTPVTIEKREGYTSKAFTLFSGTSTLIEEAKAFSAKKLETLAATALSNPKLPSLKETVLIKSGLKVVEPVEVPA